MRRVYTFLFLVLFFAASIFATEFISETQKPYVRQMKINASNFDSFPATIEANCFIMFILCQFLLLHRP